MTLTRDWTLMLDMKGLPGFPVAVHSPHTASMRPLLPEMAQWIRNYTRENGEPPSGNKVIQRAGAVEGRKCSSPVAKKWIEEAMR